MAKNPTTSKQPGLTRGKVLVIGVLAIALVAVLYIQYGRSGGDDVFESVDTTASRAPAPPTATNAAATNAEPEGDTRAAILDFDQAKWESPKLSVVTAYDPFALPASFPRPPKVVGDPLVADGATDALTEAEKSKQLADALEALQTQLENLKQRGVQVIVSKNDQYVAMIGDRMLHVGDEINGFTVTEIDPNGVRVERKDPE